MWRAASPTDGRTIFVIDATFLHVKHSLANIDTFRKADRISYILHTIVLRPMSPASTFGRSPDGASFC